MVKSKRIIEKIMKSQKEIIIIIPREKHSIMSQNVIHGEQYKRDPEVAFIVFIQVFQSLKFIQLNSKKG